MSISWFPNLPVIDGESEDTGSMDGTAGGGEAKGHTDAAQRNVDLIKAKHSLSRELQQKRRLRKEALQVAGTRGRVREAGRDAQTGGCYMAHGWASSFATHVLMRAHVCVQGREGERERGAGWWLGGFREGQQ